MSKHVPKIADSVFPGAGTAGKEGVEAVGETLIPKPQLPEMPAAPSGPPATDPAAIAARDAAAEEERRRVRGRTQTNITGGLGDTSRASLAVKSLLGT